MKILFLVGPEIELLESGYFLRTYHLCKELKRKGHKVIVAHLSPSGSITTHAFEALTSVTDRVQKIPYALTLEELPGKVQRTSMLLPLINANLFASKDMLDLRERILVFAESEQIDIVHAQGHFVGTILTGVSGPPYILDLADSTSLYLHRQAKVAQRLLSKIVVIGKYLWVRAFERSLLSRATIATVVSPADKEMLESICRSARIIVVPNGVDSDYFKPAEPPEDDAPAIAFHGNMSFEPNILAAKYIYEKILPMIKMSVPDTKFYIIGRNPSTEVLMYKDDNRIVVTGHVPDIRSYLAKSTVVVAPMIAGSGMKNKILEAISMGKPVVTNPLGAEAFDNDLKGCLLIGEDHEEMANLVIELLKNNAMRTAISNKAREIVKRNYGWESAASKYECIYRIAMGSTYQSFQNSKEVIIRDEFR
jgi:glycosyltransferase involved in cell wall biosynthesis